MTNQFSILFLTVMVPSLLFGQVTFKPEYNVEKIAFAEFQDTLKSKKVLAPTIRGWFDSIKSMHDDPKIFLPCSQFDSVEFVEYQEDYFNLTMFGRTAPVLDSIIPELVTNRYNVEIERTFKILDYLNNPSSYEWSECGSPYAEQELVFYLNGKIVNRILIACDTSFIKPINGSPLIKWGQLTWSKQPTKLALLLAEIKK